MRIDLADPSGEGDAIARALSEVGFDVTPVAPDRTPPTPFRASLVILAGDAPGALPALDRLRALPHAASIPVLLVGVPAGGPQDAETLRTLGADAVYPRPVPLERLVRKVQTYLTPAEELRRSEAQPPPAGPSSRPPGEAPSHPPREPTVRLPPEGADVWEEPDAWAPPASSGEHEPTPPGLSTHVMRLVREADRRLFPDAPELDVSVIDPGDALELLLGDDLLAPAPLPEDPGPEPVVAGDGAASTPDPEQPEATTAVGRSAGRTPREIPHTAPLSVPGQSGVGRRMGGRGRVLGADLPALLLQAASIRYGAQDVHDRLGPGGPVRLVADARTRLGDLGLQPELADWAERHDGEQLDVWLAGDPPGATAPGLLLVLAELDVLSVHAPGPGSFGEGGGRAASRARIAAAHALAEDGDYFAILGVPPDAGTEEILAAHDARRHELLATGAPDPELTERRRIALDVLAEARRILSIPRLREAYRDALQRG